MESDHENVNEKVSKLIQQSQKLIKETVCDQNEILNLVSEVEKK